MAAEAPGSFEAFAVDCAFVSSPRATADDPASPFLLPSITKTAAITASADTAAITADFFPLLPETEPSFFVSESIVATPRVKVFRIDSLHQFGLLFQR